MSPIESLFNNTFSVYRKTRVHDGQGGWGYAYPETATSTVEGRMRPASAAEMTIALQRQAEISHVLYVLASEDIRRGDRITGDDGTWDVIAVREPSRADHHLEIDCYERQIEGEPA